MPQLGLRGAPQLSRPLSGPQPVLLRAQNAASLSGTQLFTHWPTLHVWLVPQAPQLATDRGTMQLSTFENAPHVLPLRAQNAASLSATHVETHWPFAVHALPGEHVPHEPPQPLGPHCAPAHDGTH